MEDTVVHAGKLPRIRHPAPRSVMIPIPHHRTRTALRRRLLAWFGRGRRDLPWRRRRSLYGTWISEIMLQQTTVTAVVPFWERFMDRFPDVASLAAADPEEVLRMWSGLGYYRRARQLHTAAQRVMQDSGGRLPRSRDGWLDLPGVGPYAAGAIASLGLGEAVPALDVNARRVLLRWSTDDPGVASGTGDRRLEDIAAALVPADAPGTWNEAVMELGALVCRARNPDCGPCPVRRVCRAGRGGTAALVPPPARRTRPTAVTATALVATDGAHVLMMPAGVQPALIVPAWGEPVRDDLRSLHRGLWGTPVSAWYNRNRSPAHALPAWDGWLADQGVHSRCIGIAGTTAHAITRWRLGIVVVRADLGPDDLVALASGLDSRTEGPAGEVPISRLAARIIDCGGSTLVDR